MRKISALMVVLLCTSAVVGCSNIPVAVKHQTREQEKFRSVSHWNDLAYAVAVEAKKAITDLEYSDASNKSMYILRNGNSPFSAAFYEMLETSLVRMGLQVSRHQETDNILLECDILTFKHDARYKGQLGDFPGGIPSLMGAGLISLLFDPYENTSENEVLVTISMSYRNRYILKNTTPYYIHDADFKMYHESRELPSVKVRIQNE